MDLGIKGKLALITAASGGMGRQIAHTLAAEGANLVLFSRSEEKLHKIALEIESDYGSAVAVVAGDMASAEDTRRLASNLNELGGAEIAILLSGRPPNPLRETLDETDQLRWDEAYRTQLWGVIEVVNAIIPSMLAHGWGRVIAITSASAKQPMARHAISTVFRAGVAAYMKGLANEVAARGVTVNCVAPALIDTSHRLGSSAYTSEQTAYRKTLTPMGRMGTQAELCGVVAFLASQQAGFVTGSTIAVEGGMTASVF